MNVLKNTLFCLSVSCVASGVVAEASAQAPAGPVAGNEARNVSVRERARPEYDALGVRLGGFTLFPTLDLSARFDDNVFATTTNEKNDVSYVAGAGARLQSNWSVHALSLNAGVQSNTHDKYSALDYTTWNVGADGRLDIVRGANISGAINYVEGGEPLYDNPNVGLSEPIQYRLTTGRLAGEWALARTKLSVFATSDKYDYDDGRLFNRAIVDQDDRDRTVTEGGARVDFSISPDTALFLAAKANKRDYRLNPPAVAVNRNSDGYDAIGGVSFDLSRLVRGEIGIGYMHQAYDAKGVADTNQTTGNLKVEWFPTQILTVTGKASRFVGDSGLVGTPSFLGTTASIGADYELRRNVILSLEGAYNKEDYEGVARSDDRWVTTAGVDYVLNRGIALYGNYQHFDQNSSGAAAGRVFQGNVFTIGLRLRR